MQTDLFCQLQIARLNSLCLLGKGDTLEEWNGLFLPEDAVVFLLQVDKWVGGLAVPDVWQARLDSQTQMITNHLLQIPVEGQLRIARAML